MIATRFQSAKGLGGIATGEDGPAVAWLHGYTMDSTIWHEVWARLPGFQHIGIDLPGHGSSGPIEATSDLRLLARRVAAEAIERGARHIVGLSFGSMVAIEVVLQHPGHFETLTVGAPTLGGLGFGEAGVRDRYLELVQLAKERGRGPWLRELWMSVPPGIFAGAVKKPGLWQLLRNSIDRHGWSELGSDIMQRLAQCPQDQRRLSSISVRTLVLVGEEDMPTYKRCGEIIRRSIIGSQRAYLPLAGHLCLLEDPDSSARLVSAHLSGGFH